jgi:FkbM family methyltransferase
MKVIYDLGANSGLNIPYYLLKADKVVAVEANPALARKIINRFQSEITVGRVCVENCALVNSLNQTSEITFYVHNRIDVWSTVKTPSSEHLHEFKQLQVPCKNVVDLIRVHGDPFYIKVDIEGLDAEILTDLFNAQIVPPYISAEVHNIDVFCALVQLGKYNSFKLVDGQTVPVKYRSWHVHALDRSQVSYSFPCDSAGPFGNDVDGAWLDRQSFMPLRSILQISALL